MSLCQCHPVEDAHLRKQFSCLEIVLDLLEYPRMSVSGASDHDGIHSVPVKIFLGLLRRVYVSVSDDRNMHSRVFLHLSDQSPVRLSRVHLASCASVDGQSLDSHILESLGKLNDDLRVFIPSESRLYGHGKLDRLHHLSGDLHHLIRFSHHSGASTSSCNLVHRTTEIDVHKVCTMPSGNLCRSFCHHGRIHHRLRNVSVDLDSDRSLVIICDELLERLSCISDKSI